ncbi:hypothetical protein BU23DRAFT_540477 [Bimuria novae-zelandiae CBS 107.79]|uniref:Zn(2)-C6 fungal-type domain-containing protein n=1 Tax=Bimuria novae-zelandiae CBS 107.79 TaxID=1447943 RepID=A0A6A5UYN3_9PLEO|nr:hypothetical protein BU23DRAFT_540477 [Bimuria novae-zelandiae CBS 107.79]
MAPGPVSSSGSSSGPHAFPAALESRISNPGKKRPLVVSVRPDSRQKRKVTRACDACKTSKAKCSGTHPCDSCEKRGRQCRYEARYSRGKPPLPPQSSLVREQSMFNNSSSAGSDNAMSPAQSPYQSPAQKHTADGLLPARGNLPTARIAHHNQVGEQPQQDVTSRGSPDLEVIGQYVDSTSGLSFLHRACRRLSNQDTQVLGPLASTETDQPLTSAGDVPVQVQGLVRVPDVETAHRLLSSYFDVCIATYRLLHRPSVEQWLQSVLTNSKALLPLWTGIGRPRAAIVLAVLAVAIFHEQKAKGAVASSSPADAGNPLAECDELFCEATRMTDAETGFPKLESAQARLVQVLYLLMSSRMNQAWYTFGHTSQIISALGLHRQADRKRHSQQHDYIKEQCQKRTFWVAYILDKYLAFVFGRPRHYHDDDIDQVLPDPVNDDNMGVAGILGETMDDCHIESLIHHARLAQIAEKISREVYSIKPIPDHDRITASHHIGRELRRWKASLPPFLGAIKPSSLIASFRRQAVVLKLAYCHAVIMAHRPFLLKNLSNRPETRDLAQESISECVSAAQSVLESVDRMAQDGQLFHAFWWTHYVCFCALAVIYVWAIQQSISHSMLNHTSLAKIFDLAERCLVHLARATASNSPSRRYSIILQGLRAEAKRKTARRPADAVTAIPNTDLSSALSPLNPDRNLETMLFTNTLEPLFGSPIDAVLPDMSSFLDNWQTTDWLGLDCSAFVGFETTPMD